MGTLSITSLSGGGVYIGSSQSAAYQVTGGPPNDTSVTSATWSVNGAGQVYAQNVQASPYNGSSQVVPSPAATNPASPAGTPYNPPKLTTLFQQADFKPPAATPVAPRVSFVCPAQPGPLKVEVTVTLSIDLGKGAKTTTVSAAETIDVIPPTLQGGIYYLKNGAHFVDQPPSTYEYTYSSSVGIQLPPGEKFPNGSNQMSGPIDGMTYNLLTVPSTEGLLKIEQIVKPGTSLVMSATPPATGKSIAYYYLGTNSQGQKVQTPAPYPLLDLPNQQPPPSAPWYTPAGDSPFFSPQVKYPSGNWTDNFEDFVMFQPTGGIWVPEATFSWSLSGPITYTLGSGWTKWVPVTVSKFKVTHTTWPGNWLDLSYIYLSTLNT